MWRFPSQSDRQLPFSPATSEATLGSFTIWVDAICINQDDEAEKSRQIRLMSAIYRGATEVFIWLGDGNERTNRAMSYLEAYGPLERGFMRLANKKRDIGFWSPISTLFSLYITRWMPHMHLPPPKSYVKPGSPKETWYRTRTTSGVVFASAEDITELLDREWIKRIWTYQELMLANNPILVCGDHAISWSDLAMKLATFHYTRIESTSPTLTAWRRITLTREHVQAQLEFSAASPKKADNHPFLRIDLGDYHQFLEVISGIKRFVGTVFTLVSAVLLFFFLGLGLVFMSTMVSLLDELGPAEPLDKKNVTNFSGGQCQQEHTDTKHCKISSLVHYARGCGLFLAGISSFAAFVLIDSKIGYVAKTPPGDAVLTKGQKEEDSNLHDLIDAVCTRNATDPKDKAFGLYPILEELLQQRLPMPDYSLPIGQVYRALTLYLLQATDSMLIILVAATHNVAGEPSWVVNWSAEFPRFWLRPSLITGKSKDLQKVATDTANGRHWRPLSEADDKVLVVQGQKLWTVRTCLSLQRTASFYRETDDACHLHNLHVIMCILKERSAQILKDLLSDSWNHPDLPDDIGPLNQVAYWKFLRRNISKPAATMLQLLKKRKTGKVFLSFHPGTVYKRRHRTSNAEIFRTHIAICNSLVRTNRMFFSAVDIDDEGEMGDMKKSSNKKHINWGVCLHRVQVGDDVILVRGLEVPIVVRRNAEYHHQLISPAVVSKVPKIADKSWEDKLYIS
ncbi:hypothetical protein CLAIMM_12270 [Cladophialophora immunda]|nr:hypothetical protein CLAIMM_12270 [Cladophialophora immunda]